MATAPEFGSTPNKGTPGSLTAANTSFDGTGSTGRQLALTASSGKGTFLPGMLFHPKGGNVATLIRIFKNNGSDPEVAANNALIKEQAIELSTLSQVAENKAYYVELNVALKGDASTPERLYWTLATAVATGIIGTPINAADL